MMMMKYHNLLLVAGIIICLLSAACSTSEFRSPSGKISARWTKRSDTCALAVGTSAGQVASVVLGLAFDVDVMTLGDGQKIEVEAIARTRNFNEYLLKQKGESVYVRLRLYDDALVFRYENAANRMVHIRKELSAWTLPRGTTVWYFERRNAWKLKSYAGIWEHASLDSLYKVASSPVQGTPVVFRLHSGKYGFISEAALENYSGMRLEVGPGNTLSANFTEGTGGFDVPARFKSPWRILFLGDDLNALVNQKIIKELSPSPDGELYADRSYILPGKCAWRWFAKGTGTPGQERQVIDEASRLDFRYSLVDDGWKNWKDCWKEAEQLVRYADKKGIRLLFWQHSGPLRDRGGDYAGMRSFLDSIAFIGAAGVKVDFMDSEAKSLIDFEIRLLRECARRKLVVNFHGCHSPTGEAYTYPNELTREGIRGMELNKMQEGYIPAYHNAALPFTRLMVGHGDYTPLSFTVPGATTFAHQLATLVCFDSPLQTIAEDPGLLLDDSHVNAAAGFIREVPTVWDEVKVLPGSEIARLAVLAKRKGEDWYIGVLNGQAEEKIIELDLASLVERPSWVEAYLDDLEAEKVILPMEGHRKGALKREASVPFKVIRNMEALTKITLAAYGGGVIVLHKRIDGKAGEVIGGSEISGEF